MAYPKGKKRPEGAGRRAGTPNKSTQDLLRICEEEGIEPFRAMIRQLAELDQPNERFNALEKVCQYLYPKRKALELDLDPENQGIKIVIEDYGKK